MLLADSRYPELTPPPRIQLWTNGSLEVSQVQMDDTGDYQCEIITESGKALQKHAIEVQCKLFIIFLIQEVLLELTYLPCLNDYRSSKHTDVSVGPS